jgi:hypothetical protein
MAVGGGVRFAGGAGPGGAWRRASRGAGSPIEVILNRPAVPAGDTFEMFLVVDAPSTGEVKAYLDGLGVLWDSFVLRYYEVHRDSCLPPISPQCRRCPAGHKCFRREMAANPATPPGRYQLPLTVTDANGRTTRTAVALDVRAPRDADADGLPDAWEFLYLRGGPEFAPDGDPDGDGVSNIEEFRRDTNPVARYTRYFAEGSAGDRSPAHSLSAFAADLEQDGYRAWVRALGDGGRRTRSGGIDTYRYQADRVVALVVETEAPAAVERVMSYVDGSSARGAPFRGASMEPASRWYFADGGTDGTLDTFYLTYNPTAAPVEATIAYRLANGALARQSRRTIEPGTRTTIWTNVDDAALGRVEASAEITATAPIVVERAWRFDPPGRTVTQPLATPGSHRPSTRWVFAEADGDARFDTTIVVANAAPQAAVVDVSLIYGERAPASIGQLRIPPRGRTRIPVRQLPGLAGMRASIEVVSTNGALVVAERTFIGRDADGWWRIATPGAPAPARRWVWPRSQAGSSTDLVVTNLSPFDAQVEVYFAKSDSYVFDNQRTKLVTIPARRRLVYPVGVDDPAYPYTPGITRVTSQPTARGTADIVAELVSYGEGEFGPRTRASGVLGTPVP